MQSYVKIKDFACKAKFSRIKDFSKPNSLANYTAYPIAQRLNLRSGEIEFECSIEERRDIELLWKTGIDNNKWNFNTYIVHPFNAHYLYKCRIVMMTGYGATLTLSMLIFLIELLKWKNS